MNNSNSMLKEGIFAGTLILLQLLVFNNVAIFKSYSPYVYILFILLYPTEYSKYSLLLWAFGIGVVLDFFSFTGGLHAFSSVFLAFFRDFIIHFISGKRNLDMDTFYFYDLNLFQKFFYVTFCVLIHHGVLFLLENFKLDGFKTVGLNTLYSTGLTILILFIYFSLFVRKREGS